MTKRAILPSLAIILTVFAGILYVTVQQTLRWGANEPQHSMAAAAAKRLDNGAKPGDIVSGQIDMRTDMTPFIIIYDKSGKVLAADGYLGRKAPQIPVGVLQTAGKQSSDAVTWTPENDVRIASVSVPSHDYYVTSGRNLQVVEKQLRSWTWKLLATWLMAMVVLTAIWLAIRHHEQNSRTTAGPVEPVIPGPHAANAPPQSTALPPKE